MPSFKILSRKTFIILVFLRCATQTVSRHTNVTKAQQPHNFCPRFSPPPHAIQPDTQPDAIRVPTARTGLDHPRIPPTVACAPQSAATYTRAPPGLYNPNTPSHRTKYDNTNYSPQSRTKRNHTADTPHPTTHTTHHVCSIHNNQTRTNQSNHTPYDNIASVS